MNEANNVDERLPSFTARTLPVYTAPSPGLSVENVDGNRRVRLNFSAYSAICHFPRDRRTWSRITNAAYFGTRLGHSPRDDFSSFNESGRVKAFGESNNVILLLTFESPQHYLGRRHEMHAISIVLDYVEQQDVLHVKGMSSIRPY